MKQKTVFTRKRNNFLVFGSPLIGEEEIQEVVNSMHSGWLGTGQKVFLFEEEFKKYRQSSYAVAVSSCTAALHLSLLTSGIKPGDEVITSAMTFCSSVNAIIHCGAIPVLADCDPITRCIDPEYIRKEITPKTKAIIPVHFGGNACNMDTIMNIAQEHNLKVIEDCAHSIETTYRGRPVGTFGDFGCFSFYVTKNVVTGEGGMVLTKNKENADMIKTLALHGMNNDAWSRYSDRGFRHYDVILPGFKYNMMDLQAAIGIHQLKRVEQNWECRKTIWGKYQQEFSQLPLGLPTSSSLHVKHGYHLYTILVDSKLCEISRDDFLVSMTNENIGVGVHYRSIPTHLYYQKAFGWQSTDYPSSKKIGEQTLSLPLSAKLSDKDVNDVIQAVHKILHSK